MGLIINTGQDFYDLPIPRGPKVFFTGVFEALPTGEILVRGGKSTGRRGDPVKQSRPGTPEPVLTKAGQVVLGRETPVSRAPIKKLGKYPTKNHWAIR